MPNGGAAAAGGAARAPAVSGPPAPRCWLADALRGWPAAALRLRAAFFTVAPLRGARSLLAA
jgi:hypothetical protein